MLPRDLPIPQRILAAKKWCDEHEIEIVHHCAERLQCLVRVYRLEMLSIEDALLIIEIQCTLCDQVLKTEFPILRTPMDQNFQTYPALCYRLFCSVQYKHPCPRKHYYTYPWQDLPKDLEQIATYIP